MWMLYKDASCNKWCVSFSTEYSLLSKRKEKCLNIFIYYVKSKVRISENINSISFYLVFFTKNRLEKSKVVPTFQLSLGKSCPPLVFQRVNTRVYVSVTIEFCFERGSMCILPTFAPQFWIFVWYVIFWSLSPKFKTNIMQPLQLYFPVLCYCRDVLMLQTQQDLIK